MTTDGLPFLSAAAIREAVPIDEMLDAVDTAYRDVAAGRDRSPLRTRVELAGGDLLLMPGVRDGGHGASVKLVTVIPANADRGLPTVQALVVWLDALTGRPLALMDGETVTAMRTGAASGVASRLLARPDAATLAVLGVGAQAAWQVRAVLTARPIRRVVVFARSAEARADFAARMSAETGIEVTPAGDPETAVRSADIVCCATTSGDPVFDAASIRPGTHVNGIGAFRLGMVEIPPALFERAQLVAVDSRSAARAEAGDVVSAIESGLLAEEALVEIGSVAPGWAASRPADAITVFKSVGLAIQDAAAAELIAARLLGVSEPGH
jgi:ornithine cyclodeaminase